MMTKLTLTFLTCLLPLSSLASVHLECGDLFSAERGNFNVHVLTLSSVDGSFEGANGRMWSIALERNQWLPAGSARAREEGPLTIFVRKGEGATGEVGTEYEINSPLSIHSQLTIREVGGFAGNIVVGKYDCLKLQ